MTASAWTPDRVDRLRTLWREGRSAAWISLDLGHGISRSAVLGKLFRLGLSAPPRSTSGRSLSRGGVALGGTPAAAAPPTRAPELPDFGTVTVLSVRRFDCRWPYGDPAECDFALCGRRVARGAYCAGHAAIAYRRKPQRLEDLVALAGLA